MKSPRRQSNRNPSLLWRFVTYMLVGSAVVFGIVQFFLEPLPTNLLIAVLFVTGVAWIAISVTPIDSLRLAAATYRGRR